MHIFLTFPGFCGTKMKQNQRYLIKKKILLTFSSANKYRLSNANTIPTLYALTWIDCPLTRLTCYHLKTETTSDRNHTASLNYIYRTIDKQCYFALIV